MSDSTERLISSLGDDLEPVRPLPSLRTAFAVILSVWATLLGLIVLGGAGDIAAGSLVGSRIYLASFIGLLVAAFGATASALAAGIPGRERIEQLGMLLASVGLVSGAVACLIGMRSLGSDSPVSPPGLDAMCFEEAALLSLLPAGVILTFLVRGWVVHPVRAALIALLGAGALGALIVHLNCGFLGPKHVLMGHLSVPIVLALLGLYPIAVILRRWRG
jgi:Negative regulator of sigma F